MFSFRCLSPFWQIEFRFDGKLLLFCNFSKYSYFLQTTQIHVNSTEQFCLHYNCSHIPFNTSSNIIPNPSSSYVQYRIPYLISIIPIYNSLQRQTCPFTHSIILAGIIIFLFYFHKEQHNRCRQEQFSLTHRVNPYEIACQY